MRIYLGKEFHELQYVQQQEIVIGHLEKFFNDFNLRRVDNPLRVYVTTLRVTYNGTSTISCDVKIVE
ncbi:hypothetical protein Xoosp13_383 [Xanthomonas phage Xoo-sp13]|nr:hypothetical protein Xoosp13_383 [Xanthomonas phage Xoo-sp13]